MARCSQHSDLIVPKTVRLHGGKVPLAANTLERAGIVPPIILRQAGTHTGRIVGLFDRIDEAVGALGPGEYVATQFVDFSSADGFFRKFRVYFIGPHVILRHMIISDQWNVHVKDRMRFMAERPELVAEERALFESAAPFAPKVKTVFHAVANECRRFLGMDFGITRTTPLCCSKRTRR